MGTPEDSIKTRARIIDTAGKLFADRGYKGVTVREIIKEANTHQGALNYHFNGKELLYKAVILEACRKSSITDKEQHELKALNPMKALEVLISGAIKEYKNNSDWHSTILTRECWDPSEVFLEAANEYFKPETHFIADIIGKIVNKPASNNQVLFAVITMIVLIDTFCSYNVFINSVAPSLTPKLKKKGILTKQIYNIVITTAKSDTLK